MSRKALAHAYPQWQPPDDDPGAPTEDYREVWIGRMRIVRNRRRIRKLKRRGVPMMDLRPRNADGCRGPRCMAWFVEDAQ
jgi:hypothetical protein